MAREFFKEWNPQAESMAIVRTANNIIREYLSAGYVLTLRQLYYQFVARDLIPNSERSYKNLGNLVTKARMAGLMDWEAIEDRNREFNRYYFEEDEERVIRGTPELISYDYWKRQPYYVEVWVEKEALGNVIEKACAPFHVPHMACKGYLSASEAWRAGKRMKWATENNQPCIVIHLGDHDPSGLDMTRDNSDRLDMFSYGATVERIALNRDQIDQYTPPPNPAKITDSRAKEYIKRHGSTSWELDALEPGVLVDLIQKTISKYVDDNIWDDIREREREAKKELRKLSDNWQEVREFLDTL